MTPNSLTQDRQKVIDKTLTETHRLLEKIVCASKTNPHDWGYPGTLGDAARKLEDVNAVLRRAVA